MVTDTISDRHCRSHRERKETYLRMLEEELANLRRDRVLLIQRAERAEAEMAKLTGIVSNQAYDPTSLATESSATAFIDRSPSGEEILHLSSDNLSNSPTSLQATRNTDRIATTDVYCVSHINQGVLVGENAAGIDVDRQVQTISGNPSNSPLLERSHISMQHFREPKTKQKGIDFILA